MNAIYRTGLHTRSTCIALFVIQPYPPFPFQCIVRTGGDAFMVFACQTDTDVRFRRPFTLYNDTGSFGGTFANVKPRADSHTYLAFGTKRWHYVNHLLVLRIDCLPHKSLPSTSMALPYMIFFIMDLIPQLSQKVS